MAADAIGNTPDTLQTLSPDGGVPKTRMADAVATQNVVLQLIRDDYDAGRMRGAVDGLVDGNLPYKQSKLVAGGRRGATNVNFGTGRGYMESGNGPFWDLYSEAPGKVFIETNPLQGTEEDHVRWSQIMSEKADMIFEQDRGWSASLQTSQNEMVLHGTGPLFFEDEYKVFPIALETKDLLVPKFTRSDLTRWELCAICMNYYPPELYEKIMDERSAKIVGWKVPYTKQVIANATNIIDKEGRRGDWEMVQLELKTKAFWSRISQSKVIQAAHVFWTEFDHEKQEGRISHGVVDVNNTTGGTEYMFFHERRYNEFEEFIHPMYFDRGRGGYHHTVTGLGPKMFGAMQIENRTLCRLVDRALAPTMMFQPTSAEATQKLQLSSFGDYGVLPYNTQVTPVAIQGHIQEGSAMVRYIEDLMRSNLSQYRQQVAPEKQGNPVTAYEKQVQVSQQSSLSNTTYSRYYDQLDALYEQIVSRLCNLNSTDRRAIKFQEECEAAGVPQVCFGRVRSVRAVRVIGQGSPFMRQQVTSELIQVIGMLPETGQNNLKNDYIAAKVGPHGVPRYNPKPTKMASSQRERAMNQVANMRIGVPPVPVADQDPVIFAQTFLQACMQAIQSVSQGANPTDVLNFLNLAGPATMLHVQRMAKDPFSKQLADAMEKQLADVSAIADKLKQMLAEQAKKMKEQQQKTAAVLSEEQLAQIEAQNSLAIKNAKAAQQMQQKNLQMQQKQQSHVQDMMIKDSLAASEIDRANKKAMAEAVENPA